MVGGGGGGSQHSDIISNALRSDARIRSPRFSLDGVWLPVTSVGWAGVVGLLNVVNPELVLRAVVLGRWGRAIQGVRPSASPKQIPKQNQHNMIAASAFIMMACVQTAPGKKGEGKEGKTRQPPVRDQSKQPPKPEFGLTLACWASGGRMGPCRRSSETRTPPAAPTWPRASSPEMGSTGTSRHTVASPPACTTPARGNRRGECVMQYEGGGRVRATAARSLS